MNPMDSDFDSAAQLGSLLAHKLAEAVEGMPAFPQSVRKILVLTQNPDCDPKELIAVIDKDPVVTVKILRVVNSSYYNLPQKIVSLHHAVVYLGFNTIKNLALAIAAIGSLPQSNVAGIDAQLYLQHCLSVAGIAKRLASRVRDADPVDCFIAGLLHDFGKIILAQVKPVEFRMSLQSSLEDGESLHLALRRGIGTDHSAVGAMLIERWRFPVALKEAIQYQYGPEIKDTGLSACLFAANQVSKKLQLGFAGNVFVEEFPPSVRQRLGGTLDEVTASLGDLGHVFDGAQFVAQL